MRSDLPAETRGKHVLLLFTCSSHEYAIGFQFFRSPNGFDVPMTRFSDDPISSLPHLAHLLRRIHHRLARFA